MGIDDEITLEIDEEHEFFQSDFSIYKYVDGELVKDEERQQQLVEQHEREQNKPNESDMLALAILELATEIEKLKGEK